MSRVQGGWGKRLKKRNEKRRNKEGEDHRWKGAEEVKTQVGIQVRNRGVMVMKDENGKMEVLNNNRELERIQ